MLDRLSAWVLRILRVPTEPSVPVGSTRVQLFRASPRYFRYRLVLWTLAQLGALIGLVVGIVVVSLLIRQVNNPWIVFAFRGTEAVAWFAFLLQIPFTFAILRLDFELRWYILSDRSLRIREGILSLHEKTMTFANIQQISIRENPLQRILRIADVQVRSAGGGGGSGESGKANLGESTHEAWFRGVDNAEAIRAAIGERVRLHRDAGLGDPDENDGGEAVMPAHTPGVLDAARVLYDEVRLLHADLRADPIAFTRREER